MGKGLLGPSGGSGGTLEGRFGEHCGGNGGIGGSMFGVGEGKDESMGGMGGGSLARRSMVSNDGRGGGGLVVAVSRRLSLLLVGDTCGIEVWEVGVVGGGPDTYSDGGGSAGAIRRRALA
ncbi:hypothetical protein Tco_1140495 [Tanacetum coccineum]